MNEVFIIGKVITEVKFDFILNSKHISVAGFRTVTVCDEQEIVCCNKKEYRTITRHICEELNEEMRERRLSDRIFLKI